MTDAYTLVQDDPARPMVEESLSRLESTYTRFMHRVNTGERLNDDDRVHISIFVGALHARTKGMMASRQALFDDITDIAHRMMGNDADKSIEPWGDVSDAGKRQIGPSSAAFAEVTGPHMILLAQETRLPFVTSDHPVTHMMIHADELVAMGTPDEWFYRNIPRSAREFFVFCPLTPRLAYLSSRFFSPSPDVLRATTADPRLLFMLNEITRTNADRDIYAPSPAPYGPLLPLAHQHDRLRAASAAHPENFLRAYSPTERYDISTAYVEHGSGAHPLTGRLTFQTDDITTLRAVAAESDLVLVEIFRDGALGGWLRQAWFVQVAIQPEGHSVIENGPIRSV